MAKRIITISREFGSGGRFIGEEVAKKLGVAYYDKSIINQIAEQSGLSQDYIQESEELSPKKGLFGYAFAGRDMTGKSVFAILHLKKQFGIIFYYSKKLKDAEASVNQSIYMKIKTDMVHL